jgi:hypothetical protein
MSRASKERRKRRKLVSRTLTVLRRNLVAVAHAMAKDLVWGRTPDETAICVEAMLFTITAEFEDWPDGWKHKHYVWPDGQCSCGHRIDVTFDGVTPVDGTTLENRVYHMTRDMNLGTVTVAQGVTVYYGPWRFSHREFAGQHGRRGAIRHSPPEYMHSMMINGRQVGIGERVHQPLWDTLIRETGNPRQGDVTVEQALTTLEMGPPQR